MPKVYLKIFVYRIIADITFGKQIIRKNILQEALSNGDRKMKKTLLSVIVPAYNRETYISECLQSVLSQMPENCELIVVDDGSTDATPQILETYGRSYPNVRIFIREHKGASGARNTGLVNAKGEYVTFLDCDDCLAEHFLENALPLLMPEEHTDSQDSMDASFRK